MFFNILTVCARLEEKHPGPELQTLVITIFLAGAAFIKLGRSSIRHAPMAQPPSLRRGMISLAPLP